ncbi:Fe-S cluster assembly protein SufD [Methylobrevis pamukkalensis]|uniref:FeS cluster assembly protein SufD n=1 Tax=Methylobrevis pamukkalensis TaxID=1439726 RepID=A0A1E3H4J6_9HYPH|nr:Fe-S cluster assembly protein SufD [Methylobrevis pamukkalensis]ODN71253.1 FeS cluster assembly protein SufD [Methylobrevis pamukkalensis]
MNAEPIRMRTAAEEGFSSLFDASLDTLPGTDAVKDARRQAIALVKGDGLPHRRVEAFHYTDLRALIRSVPPLAHMAENAVAAPLAGRGILAGFTNGRLTRVPETAEGVSFVSLTETMAMATDFAGPDVAGLADTVVALNAAFVTDGARFVISATAAEDTVIELQSVTVDASQTHLAHRVIVEPGASVTIVDRQSGPSLCDYLSTGSLEIDVGAGASVTLVRLQEEGDTATRLDRLAVTIGEGAKFALHSVAVGAKLWRSEIRVTITGDDVEAMLHGASLLKERQHGDVTLFVDHGSLRSTSKETFKAVATDEARAVFQGKILVRPGAQKTDGKMMSNGLLLSEKADFLTKPELEIFADDVACGHGATCGDIDETHLFYLMARGIPRLQAEQLLVAAFVEEVFDDVADETLKAALEARVDAWLRARANA